MANPPDDQVQTDKIVLPNREPHPLMFQFDVSKMPIPVAAMSIGFRDLAQELDAYLPSGKGKDDVIRTLLKARNIAANVVYDQTT